MSGDGLGGLLPALQSASAADLVPTLAGLLAGAVGARDVTLQLADYRAVVLAPVDVGAVEGDAAVRMPREEPVDGSAAGQAFREQRVVSERRGELSLVRVPVSTRGARLGVLTVVLPEPAAAADLAAIEAAADTLAFVLTVAAQGSDVFEIARRSGRLSVAAEMQWQLLPGTGLAGVGFELAGHLEPARRVGGDAFDWAHNGSTLWVSVHDAAGVADSASLACTLAVTALRNARRGQLPLAQQAKLAGEALWAQYRGDRQVSSLLLGLDARTGRPVAVDAGYSLLLRLRGGAAQALRLGGQPPLGWDEEVAYSTRDLAVDPGDRLLLFTGGALTAPSPDGEEFGLDRLAHALEQTRERSCVEAVRLITREVVEYVAGELPDDAAFVCLDWHPGS